MYKRQHLGEAQSIRGLAQYTEEVRDRFINLAISYNIKDVYKRQEFDQVYCKRNAIG